MADDHLYANVDEQSSAPALPTRSYGSGVADKITTDSFMEDDELLYADIDLEGDDGSSNAAAVHQDDSAEYGSLKHTAPAEPEGVIYSDVVVTPAARAPNLPGRSYPGASQPSKQLSSVAKPPPQSYGNTALQGQSYENMVSADLEGMKFSGGPTKLSAAQIPAAKQETKSAQKLRFPAVFMDDKNGNVPVMLHIIHRANVGKILLVFDKEQMTTLHTLPVKLMRGFGQKQEGSERRLKIEAGKRSPGGERTYRYVLDKSVKVNVSQVLRAKINANHSIRQQKKPAGNARPVYKNV